MKDRSVIEREARKLRDILAKSIYADLLSRINATNILLRKLQKDSEYPSRPRRQTPFRRPLLRCGKARKSAHSLHNSIIGGKCWKCSCKSDHKVHFILSYPSIDNLDSLTKEVENPCFGLVLAFRAENSAPESYVSTCQLQAESEFIQSSIGLHHICLSDLEGNPSTTGNFGKQKGVQLPLSKTGFGDPSQTLKRLLPPITDICTTISTIISEVDIPKSLGWLADTDHRHHITYVNRIGRSLRSKSLEDLIMASSNFSEGLTSEVFIFSQVDRLRIAVNLACSVLQFHGSWLKNGWKSRDIMFGPQITTGVGDPYVPWNVGANFEDSSLWGGTAPTLIRNRILFPLGIVLVELSLCQSMENVREPDDSDQTEEHANLKTATRLLPRVEELSGPEYAEVADRCLSWHGRKETSLEAKEMQEEIFKLIIWPLIENLRVFTIRGLGA